MSQLQLTRSNHDKTVSAAAGDDVTITLDENPTTGYRWFIENSNPDVIEVKSSDFAPGAGGSGAGGTRQITLVLQKPGTARLELNSRRDWEAPSSASDRFAVTFVVAN
jgi:inhibitor of cysteine peptidase